MTKEAGIAGAGTTAADIVKVEAAARAGLRICPLISSSTCDTSPDSRRWFSTSGQNSLSIEVLFVNVTGLRGELQSRVEAR